jgi:hypothetical protein
MLRHGENYTCIYICIYNVYVEIPLLIDSHQVGLSSLLISIVILNVVLEEKYITSMRNLKFSEKTDTFIVSH